MAGGTAKPTIGGIQTLDLLRALERIGADRERLCRAVGLDPSTLDAPEARVPTEVVIALFHEAERLGGDALVGLHAGSCSEPGGFTGYLLLSRDRLIDGLRSAHRFSRLVASTMQIRHVEEGDTLCVVYDDEVLLPGRHHGIEYFVMAGLRSLQRAAGEAIRPVAVHFRHSDRGQLAAAEQAFDCPVRFSSAYDGIVYRRDDLERPPRFPNPVIAAQVEKFAAATAARALVPPTLRSRLADEVRAMVAGAESVDRATAARRLGMSERTLKRGLADESTTFREVREEVLREVAEAMLASPGVKVEAVAFTLGFAGLAAFSKSFRRWTGLSPSAYRAKLPAES